MESSILTILATKYSNVNLLNELYSSKEGDTSKAPEFIALMESLPSEYARFLPESRWDNPFVVSITPEGIKYLRDYK
jgi:hypothetical protein